MRAKSLIRQERISTIGHLSSSIVHDLRNPLAAIYGGAEMLMDGNLAPAHVKRLAANIYHASQRMQRMLQDLLNVSRGKSGASEPCRLGEVAAASCESLAATAESHGVTLTVEMAPEIELPLERGRMERAFVNLIGNAIEAMPEGGEVRIWAQLDAGFVVAHVDDTGPGIAPEIRSKLFQPFHGRQAQRPRPGTGSHPADRARSRWRPVGGRYRQRRRAFQRPAARSARGGAAGASCRTCSAHNRERRPLCAAVSLMPLCAVVTLSL
jgi:signal transduction histidine kinase